MIISFKHRLLFVAIPKTATHTVRLALRPHLGPLDWEQCALFETRAFPVPALAKVGHGHLSCTQIKPYLPGQWDRLHKFCVVRNPFDRFFSFCYFWHRGTDAMSHQPLDKMKQLMSRPDQARNVHGFLPQAHFVADDHGALMTDAAYHLETLETDVATLGLQLGLPLRVENRANASRARDHRPPCDAELAGMILDRYADDFALFGYDSDPRDICRFDPVSVTR